MAGRELWMVVFTVSAAAICCAGEDDFGVSDLRITCDRWPDCSSIEDFYTDICEIDDAQTDQEKAVALLHWLRRIVKPGRRPDLCVAGLDRTLAVLNVFGVTDNDEMCEIATQIWRVGEGKPAYKVYLPKYDHTTAHIWYMDGKEERWHWFDYANGTYLYVRPPRRIAGANDLATDPSLYLVPSKSPVPAVDRQDTRGWTRRNGVDVRSLYEARAPGINLRPGQTLDLWNGILEGGRIEEVGPYDDFDGHGVIHEGSLDTEIVSAGPHGGTVTLFLAVDDEDKRELEKVDLRGATKKKVSIPLGERAEDNETAANVFGRRKFALTYKIAPLTPQDSLDVTVVDATVILCRNQAALPALRAGKNRITVSGKIASKCELRITYIWNDEGGINRRHVAAIRSLPYEYTIITSASNSRSVICKNFACETIYPPTVAANRIVSAPLAMEKKEDKETDAWITAKIKTQEQYVDDLKSPEMWARLHAARILAGIADENLFDAVLPYLEDGTIPFEQKDRQYGTVRSWIAAAIARTKHENAADALLKMLRKGPGSGSDAAGPDDWDLWAAIIALGKLGDDKAVAPLIDRYTFSRGPARWTIMQALTILRDERALDLMRKEILNPDIDAANAAAAGLLAMPDKDSLGPLFKAAEHREGRALRISAARLAGRFKAKEYQSHLRGYLKLDPLEEVRGWSAWALGEMQQDYGANLNALEASMTTEMSPWVLKKIEAALKKIKKTAYLIR